MSKEFEVHQKALAVRLMREAIKTMPNLKDNPAAFAAVLEDSDILTPQQLHEIGNHISRRADLRERDTETAA